MWCLNLAEGIGVRIDSWWYMLLHSSMIPVSDLIDRWLSASSWGLWMEKSQAFEGRALLTRFIK